MNFALTLAMALNLDFHFFLLISIFILQILYLLDLILKILQLSFS